MSSHPIVEPSSVVSLDRLGFTRFFQKQREALPEPVVPGRVASGGRGLYTVLTERGPVLATPSGRLFHEAEERADLPAVGDWVGLRADAHEIIVHRFARRTCVSRKDAGKGSVAQVLAANVDIVLVTTSLNADFNLRRLERYLEVAMESGARPALVLSKADLAAEAGDFLDRAKSLAPSAPALLVSAVTGEGIGALRELFHEGETGVIVGSSGVGKSTLVNCLLGAEVQRANAIRATDDRGRHTTTGRELFVLPGTGLLVDTPGLREIAPWSLGDDGPSGFDDVQALAASCRFRDCAHAGEPGCAVAAAVDAGGIDPGRVAGFRKLEAEARWLSERHDARARTETKRRTKILTRALRARLSK
jgi:ribosome biogenesis GTPase